MTRFDVAVVGLGAMGSAAALQLAQRGARVLGLDAHAPPHGLGSSHGGTRVTRLAIGEGDCYTPLAIRSHALWREIERDSGAALLFETGALIVSSDRNAARTHVEGFFAKTVAAAEKFSIAHERLDAAAIRARYPQFRVRDDEVGYFEPTAGYVRPEACVDAQLGLAESHGAALHRNEPVLSFEARPDRVEIITGKGRYEADQLILAAGPWLPQLLDSRLAAPFQVYRQVMLWFEVGALAQFQSPRFPVFIWELQNSRRGLYGFPAIDGAAGGIKVASEEFERATTARDVCRDVEEAEIAAVRDLVLANIADVTPRCLRAEACLYTVTPDFGFVIDRHPNSERVLIASPCSGHGFKHSPAIGEALADWVLEGRPRLDLSPFRLSRFA